MTSSKKNLLFNGLILLLLSFQFSAYILIWAQLLDDPSLKGMDFISFYTAGKIFDLGLYNQLFDLALQKQVQWEIVSPDTFSGGVNLSQHPPYLAPLLGLVIVDDFLTSYIRWSLVRLIVCAVIWYSVYVFLLQRGWRKDHAVLYGLAFILFFPFFLGWLGGQDTAFILLGILMWVLGLLNGQDKKAGAGLALASLSPLVPFVLSIPMMLSRWKAGAWFVVSMIGLAVYSLLMIGFEGGRQFIDLMLLSSQGEGYGLNQTRMYNLLGLLLRGLPDSFHDTARLTSWIFFALVILVSSWFWHRHRDTLRIEHIALTVLVSTFALPHLHIHGLSYLLIPALAHGLLVYEKGRVVEALCFLPVFSVIMLIASFVAPPFLNYGLYYFFMAYLFFILWNAIKRNADGKALA